MKVALISFDQPYQNLITRGMLRALAALGHEACAFIVKSPHTGVVDLAGYGATHVFSTDIPPRRVLNRGGAHFSFWLQDIDYCNPMDFYHSDLNLFSIWAWKWIPNSEYLPPATDYGTLHYTGEPDRCEADVMLSGFIAPNDDRTPVRIKTAKALVDICARRGWRLKITGLGWHHYPWAVPHWAPHKYVEPGPALAQAYRSAKVTLHDSLWTNMHQRVLECFACGGFCLSRELPFDGVDFDPVFKGIPKHHDADLEPILERLVENDAERRALAAAGRAAVAAGHTWTARLGQWIDLLSKERPARWSPP